MVCATSKASDQTEHTRSLIKAFTSRLNNMSVKLLTEHHLKFLNLKGGYAGSSGSTLVKMPHCWNHMSWLKCLRGHHHIIIFKKISLGKSSLSLYLIPPSVPYSSKSETKHKIDKNDPYINKGYVFVLSDLNSVRRH